MRNENEKVKLEFSILEQKCEDTIKENKKVRATHAALFIFKTKPGHQDLNFKFKLSSSLEISLKQNEQDLLMARKNIDLAKLNSKKLNNELENYKKINSNLNTQVSLIKLK